MDRLKVSDFYRNTQPFTVIHIPQLARAFFAKDSLYVTTNDQPLQLHRYSLTSKLKQTTIPLPFEEVLGIAELGSLVCLYFAGNQNLWVWNETELVETKSHFAAITALVAHQNHVFSGSADMTVRRWNSVKGTLVQDNKKHVLTGHTSRVNCFLSVSPLLLSGSNDKTIIAWFDSTIATHRLFGSAVKKIVLCQQSQQIAVLQQSSLISIVCLPTLLQQQKILVKRVLSQLTIKRVHNLLEMDNSFLELVGEREIQIAEINIGNVMAKPQLYETKTIVDSFCIRRLTLLAVAGKGLVIMTF